MTSRSSSKAIAIARTATRTLAALLVSWALLGEPAPALARSSTEAHLQRARDRFDYGDYDGAIRVLRRLLDEGLLVSDSQLVKAYRLLGVSLYYRGEKSDARAAFVRLLSIEPDYRLDPFFHSPRLVEFFDEVRSENEALLAPLRAQRKRLQEQRRLEEEAVRRLLEEEDRRRAAREERLQGDADLVVERVVANHIYIINWIPFGAGQLQNDQAAKAIGLATAQVITGAASILCYAFVASAPRCQDVIVSGNSPGEPERPEQICGIPPESVNLVRNMERVKWVSGALFWGLVGYGIIDAHLHFEPQRVLSERTIRRQPLEETKDREQGSEPAPRNQPLHDESASIPSSVKRSLAVSPWLMDGGAGALVTLRF